MGLAQPKTYPYLFDEYLETERKADERMNLLTVKFIADKANQGNILIFA